MARLLAVTLALAGCTQPQFEPCAITCTVACPFGLTCAADGFCHGSDDQPCGVMDGAPADSTADSTPDAPPDAPPDSDPERCVAAGVPPGCVLAAMMTCNGSCYVYCPDPLMSWDEARLVCERWSTGATLVTLDSPTDENCLLSLTDGAAVWIGLYQAADLEPDGAWAWASGAPLSYLNWAPGQPDDASGNEDCGILDPTMGGWNDDDCGSMQEFVCELP